MNDQVVLVKNPKHDPIGGSCHELVWVVYKGQDKYGQALYAGEAGLLVYPPCKLSKDWQIDAWSLGIDKGVTGKPFFSKQEVLIYATNFYQKNIKPYFHSW